MADDDRDIDEAGPRRPPRLTTPVVQLGSPGRSPFALASLIAVFLVVAIVKPWPAASEPPIQPVQPRPTPTIGPTGDPLALVHRECQDPPGWRTYTKERWSGGTLHVWISVEPATGHHAQIEDDLPTVPYATEVLGLGFCAPFRTPQRPPDGAALHVWRVDGVGGPTPRAELLTVRPAVAGLDLPYGALFGPPLDDPRPAPERWAPGRYVFQVVGPGRGYERWWAVQIDPPLHPIASKTPGSSAQPLP